MSKDGQVEIVGMEQDERPALDRIKLLRPDVILVDSGSAADDHCLTISEIFKEIPDARVISISLEENDIDIYDKQRIVASGPEDLLRAICQGSKSQLQGVEAEKTSPSPQPS